MKIHIVLWCLVLSLIVCGSGVVYGVDNGGSVENSVLRLKELIEKNPLFSVFLGQGVKIGRNEVIQKSGPVFDLGLLGSAQPSLIGRSGATSMYKTMEFVSKREKLDTSLTDERAGTGGFTVPGVVKNETSFAWASSLATSAGNMNASFFVKGIVDGGTLEIYIDPLQMDQYFACLKPSAKNLLEKIAKETDPYKRVAGIIEWKKNYGEGFVSRVKLVAFGYGICYFNQDKTSKKNVKAYENTMGLVFGQNLGSNIGGAGKIKEDKMESVGSVASSVHAISIGVPFDNPIVEWAAGQATSMANKMSSKAIDEKPDEAKISRMKLPTVPKTLEPDKTKDEILLSQTTVQCDIAQAKKLLDGDWSSNSRPGEQQREALNRMSANLSAVLQQTPTLGQQTDDGGYDFE